MRYIGTICICRELHSLISLQTPLRRSEEGFEISRYNRLGLFAWEESGIL